MKSLYYFPLTLASMMIFLTGCATAPKPADKIIISDGAYEEITVTVAEDQTTEYQGQRMPIVEIPQVLTIKNPVNHIFIFIYAKSKIKEDTVKEFMKNLKTNGFSSEFMLGSKYGNLPSSQG